MATKEEIESAMEACRKVLRVMEVPFKETDQLVHQLNPPHDDLTLPSLEIEGDKDMLISILVAPLPAEPGEHGVHVNVGDRWRGVYGLAMSLQDVKVAAGWAAGVWGGWQMHKAGYRNTNVMNINPRLQHLVEASEQKEFEEHYAAETARQEAERKKAAAK